MPLPVAWSTQVIVEVAPRIGDDRGAFVGSVKVLTTNSPFVGVCMSQLSTIRGLVPKEMLNRSPTFACTVLPLADCP